MREKIVNAHAEKLAIIAEQSKMVNQLGRFPLPVEVLQFGWQLTSDKIAELGSIPVLRERDGDVFVSNNGNYILDCEFQSISDPASLHNRLKKLLGVVETGLFVDMTDTVILSGPKV